MTPAPLTADLIARAIIAAAVNLGELTPLSQKSASITVRSYLPAATGVALEAKHPLADICRILRVEPVAVITARRDDPMGFTGAQIAAREAVRYHLKARASTTPPASIPEAVAPKSSTSVPAPAPPRRSPPKAAQSSSLPKGARVVNIGNGIQKIVTARVPPGVARHAQQQLARGADLTFVADCFGYEPDVIQAAVNELTEGATA